MIFSFAPAILMLALVVAALAVGSAYGKNIISAQGLTISEPSDTKTQMENRTLIQQKDAIESLLIYCDQHGYENKTDVIRDLIKNGFINAEIVGNSCDSAKQSYDNVVNKITDIQIKMQQEIK